MRVFQLQIFWTLDKTVGSERASERERERASERERGRERKSARAHEPASEREHGRERQKERAGAGAMRGNSEKRAGWGVRGGRASRVGPALVFEAHRLLYHSA